ncbi:hypothetical protein [Streptomyces sp. NBC_00057]|uniref:hypothetical protein n=1 Tax=Streptomyces sp. NBC_00057 TaxID=2975634 RepID=UPI003253728D
MIRPARRTVLRGSAAAGALVALGAAPAAASSAYAAGTGTAAPCVRPIPWRRLGSYAAKDTAGRRFRSILSGTTRYLIGPWYAQTYTAYAADGFLNLKGIDERAVRLPGMAALSAATALALGVYDDQTLSEGKARIRTRNLIRTLAARHKASSGAAGWGSVWQSALWAYYTGAAAWLLWEDLDGDDRARVAAMIE